ncbi:hypothetical protein OGAPHI_003112 [Ogataea philodendri]|uniref:Uncharacterized protein n=1 Tax=Ogataea philodendri TaxID=1378263 RepID=A0A9P8P812_9ASCO|nr:uncharacterized protein OGAPHI_003112 [Ogataea philodendri]KAH3667463.1 hypothetical protein OGAPHI_003112 [Ogataea philodendri]
MESKFLIPIYPLTDTVAILSLLTVLPHCISVGILALYATLNSSGFVRSTLSLVYKHKLDGLEPNLNKTESSSSSRGTFGFGFLALDLVLTFLLLFLAPGALDYIHLLAKAFVASNLASTRQKYILNAILSMIVILAVETLIDFLIKNFYLVYFDGSVVTDVFLYSAYIRYPKKPLKHLLYHLSPFKTRARQKLILRVDHFIDFLYSCLCVYTILCNVSPLIRVLLHPKQPDQPSVPSKLPSKPIPPPSAATTHKSSETKTISVSPHIAGSTIPGLFRPSFISAEEPAGQESEDSTPASFPQDRQILNMNDVSSASLVVAQNFENYCRLFLFPSFNFSTASQPTISVATPNGDIPKSKINPFVERKMKNMTSRIQQPIWSFVSAAKTMFGRPDLYSGEYYQHNALVMTSRSPDGWKRSLVDTTQCFIWYTGETAVAFELRNVYIDQLLVVVNGVVWEQSVLIGLEERELVIVSGLSPLSQYDVDFINVDSKQERELLANATVSTIHKNRTLTESKHSTPLATLQESVVTTQAAIEQEKLKLKKLKTFWRKRSSALKAEIEALNSRSNFSDEMRNYKKVESLRQAVTKSEGEISYLSKEAERLYTEQSGVDEQYLDEKRAFDGEMRLIQTFETNFWKNLEKEKAKIESLEAERVPLVQKKEKLLVKRSRIANDVKKLEQEISRLKTQEIRYRQEQRSVRTGQRAEKHRLVMNDVYKFEKQLNE